MGKRIHSIIEITTEEFGMSHTRKKQSRKDTLIEEARKHKHHKRVPTTYPADPETPPNSPRRTHTRSEAYTDDNRFFHQNTLRTQGATQTTTITVNVNDKDDCLTGCFSGISKCFGKGQ